MLLLLLLRGTGIVVKSFGHCELWSLLPKGRYGNNDMVVDLSSWVG